MQEAIPELLLSLKPVGQIALILAAAWLILRLGLRLLHGLYNRYQFPHEWLVGGGRVFRALVVVATVVLVLARLGVSGSTLLATVTGFIAVAAVAFFAAWSVLSNLFCAVLIFTTRLFRPNDQIEIIEAADKPGLAGRVVRVNAIYTTLEEKPSETGQPRSTLRIPNTMFFQRIVRRWDLPQGQGTPG